MKTFDERKQNVQNQIHLIRRRRRKAVSIAASSVLALALLLTVLFVPYDTTPPDVSKYADSEYYSVIQKLNLATYEQPRYKNRFQALGGFFSGIGAARKDSAAMPGSPMPNYSAPEVAPTIAGNGVTNDSYDSYHETTDNQVAGVIESDIVKRSDKYIYYLRQNVLSVYSVEGKDSKAVGAYTFSNGATMLYTRCLDMYLSIDCTTVTILVNGDMKNGTSTMVINLDVTDPANIQEIGRAIFAGYLITSRLMDGKILIAYQYGFRKADIDFDDPSTFIPNFVVNNEDYYVEGEDIVYPDGCAVGQYTVLCLLDGKTLQVAGSTALMGYSDELYVSQDAIYAIRMFGSTEKAVVDKQNIQISRAMTEITGISISGQMEILGTIQLEGSVKDQYSLDQYDRMLRVVTSTSTSVIKYYSANTSSGVSFRERKSNVNLYCVDLSTWQIRSSVIAFAPDGEDAQSVRFDGANAYVCTARAITFTDPVYFFDLTDPDNITWMDTGIIDGYSTSLIQLGEGFLLGIGYGDSRDIVKIEVYQQLDGKVISVCAYEFRGRISQDYKSYFVDREKDLLGFGAVFYEYDGNRATQYLLLHFDGYQLNPILGVSMDGDVASMRSILIDDYFYILGPAENGFAVNQIR